MKLLHKLILPVLFLSILILASCNLFNPEPDYMIRDNDEYELYNLMIASYAEDLDFFHVYLDINKSKALMHPDSTPDYPFLDRHLYCFGQPTDSLITVDFLKNNDTTHYLDESRLDTHAVGMYQEEFDAYWHRDSLPRGFEAYYQDYPNSRGIVYFTRPGFDPERTKAVMFYGHTYGMLGGMGGMAVFEKVDGKWKRVGGGFFWVS